MSTWIIVRHGESLGNLSGRAQGHTDSPLSDKGIKQAEALRAHLARWRIDAVYSSDLGRCMETGERALLGQSISTVRTPELREVGYGQWEGMTYAEVEESYPEEYLGMLSNDVDFVHPGGESLRDVIGRVSRFASRVKAAHPGDDNLLVVAHGGSIRALLTCLLELPASAVWKFVVDPASVSIVECHPDSAVLKLFNDTSFQAS